MAPPTPLQALLQVARQARARDVAALLEVTADALAESLGFGAVVINLYRPAFDEMEVVVYRGSEEGRDALMGERTSFASWAPVLDERFNRRGAYLILRGELEWDGISSFVPGVERRDDPDAWDPEDALFVPMHSTDGALLGVVSVDEPLSGRRPSETDLDIIVAAAGHVAAAIEQIQAAEAAARHHAAVEHLLRASARLGAGRSIDEVLGAVCDGIAAALGFQKITVLLDEHGDGELVARASRGWDELGRLPLSRVPLSDVAPLLDPAFEREGCALVPHDVASRLLPPGLDVPFASTCNGTGPLAWRRHWLIVPLHGGGGAVTGVIWVDDPADRLLPSTERLQALRLFADQAAAALRGARRLERLRHLAEHDALTELPNRRAFDDFLSRRLTAEGDGDLAVLVCDLDDFKRVNDELGHEGGDEALVRFAGVLRDVTRGGDLAARLGGEEFGLVLSGLDEHRAFLAAERLRRAMRPAFADFPLRLTVSVGIAVARPEADTPRELMRKADRALYAAKRCGRDRAVVDHAQTIDALLLELGGPDHTGDQLGAVMLLAETLDVRDDATARHSQTVGTYAEMTARALGLDPAHVERIRIAGVLHDVGNVGVADSTLNKPERLDEAEWSEMRRHPELGARMIATTGLADVSEWVLTHHERIDGRGYPQGLPGEEIPLEARILSVADAYEAMTTDRPYRTALPPAAAAAELEACAGTQFDARVVAAFLAALERVPAERRTRHAPARSR